MKELKHKQFLKVLTTNVSETPLCPPSASRSVVRWLVCHNLLKGREVSLQCCYWNMMNYDESRKNAIFYLLFSTKLFFPFGFGAKSSLGVLS